MGSDDPTTWNTHWMLADWSEMAGRDTAEALWWKVLEGATAQDADSVGRVGLAIERLVMLQMRRRGSDSAGHVSAEALRQWEATFGPKHPHTAMAAEMFSQPARWESALHERTNDVYTLAEKKLAPQDDE